ncbi:ATPase PAAT [Trichomycterus rosablanca]|uniref:ATPase PAAT n=1 Tax=Trichomycterus rosablanca TaxID=2290929 RepID=UPI002F35F183
MSLNKDVLLSAHTSWVGTSKTELHEVLISAPEDQMMEAGLDSSTQCESVRLEQTEEGSPCIITLLCRPNSGAMISTVQVVSEARTIEVYSLSGDYCGTSRGVEDPKWQLNGAGEKKSIYKSHLGLECPMASCEVKLLSLGGRSTVEIIQVSVGLRFLQAEHCPPAMNPGIDLQRVRTMMEEMGATLSPGAQNLMEMVQFQQKNKTDLLGGFLPLLMGGRGGLFGGGALACLAKQATPTEEAPSNGAQVTSAHPSTIHDQSGVPAGQTWPQSPVSPDLLPVLQSVCGQVTQLRLDTQNSPEKKNGEREEPPGFAGLEKALEKVVERRMEEVEKRLMEHMDERLNVLQQRLELTLQQITLHTNSSNQ